MFNKNKKLNMISQLISLIKLLTQPNKRVVIEKVHHKELDMM
jgi:hypothetical protein